VLFADVRLRVGDDPKRLAALGVPLKARGDVVRFQQPCACLEGNRCRIYGDRPERCRTFECRLLQRTVRGEITEGRALKLIQQARDKAERVRRILRELGDTDESVPLSRRYQRMMRQPIDLSADERIADLRGELMLAVGELAGTLESEFLA
jgi:Fe-S-cluster containining protein